MTSRASRIWVAICGITGVVMLTAHFYFPSGVPSDNAPPAVITRFVLHHHDAMLATAWLQGFGPLLYVLFALGLVYLAGGMTRFWGWLTMLASAVILTLSLIDAAFTVAAVQAVASGHAATTAVSIDLIDGPANDAIGRMFLIAPPLLLPTGAVLLGSRLLPRAFAWAAVAFGAISVVLGLAALFSAAAFSAAIVLIVAQNLWVLAAALILPTRQPPTGQRQPGGRPRTSRSTAAPAHHKAAAPRY